MKLVISPGTSILNIKQSFVKAFPFLKMELFEPVGPGNEDIQVKNAVPDITLLSEVSDILKEGELNIFSKQTVQEVKNEFKFSLNLLIHIYRQTRSGWINTVNAPYLKLEVQNDLAKESLGLGGNEIW